MHTLEIYLFAVGCYAAWRDGYGQIKQVAEIPPSIGGTSERWRVADQRLWNRVVSIDEFTAIWEAAIH
jgi:hypothetical protein